MKIKEIIEMLKKMDPEADHFKLDTGIEELMGKSVLVHTRYTTHTGVLIGINKDNTITLKLGATYLLGTDRNGRASKGNLYVDRSYIISIGQHA